AVVLGTYLLRARPGRTVLPSAILRAAGCHQNHGVPIAGGRHATAGIAARVSRGRHLTAAGLTAARPHGGAASKLDLPPAHADVEGQSNSKQVADEGAAP